MSSIRCPRCRSTLGKIEAQETGLFFVSKRGGYTWSVDGLGVDFIECSCGERYQVIRKGDGFQLKGENGSVFCE
jgi:hypothetical protein